MDKNELIKKIIIGLELLVCVCSLVAIILYNGGNEVPDSDVFEYEDAADYDGNNADVVSEGEFESEDSDEDSKEIYEDDFDEDTEPVLPDDNDWRLILVNKQHYIPENYEVSLVSINGNASKQVDERVVEELEAMLSLAREDGIPLMIVSAYRSEDRQTSLFNTKVRKYMSKGMSYMDSYSEASGSVTPPGTSEHQLGLAVDILGSGQSSLTEKFSETEAGIWLKKNCADYGFILRYPEGKEDITGIIYEPWHFRYVGKEHAQKIMDRGITLEEYLEGK